MRRLTSRSLSVAIAILVAVGVYLLALSLPIDGKMMQVQRVFPRVSLLTQQLARARSYLPAIQKPLNPLTNSPPSTLHSQHSSSFTTTTAKMTHDTMTFKDAVQNRRTIYQLQKKSTISDEKIKEILNIAIHDVPSSFNSQSARLVVLFKDEHDKFWDIVRDILKTIVPEDKWEQTGNRIAMFKNAYGTVRLLSIPSLLSPNTGAN